MFFQGNSQWRGNGESPKQGVFFLCPYNETLSAGLFFNQIGFFLPIFIQEVLVTKATAQVSCNDNYTERSHSRKSLWILRIAMAFHDFSIIFLFLGNASLSLPVSGHIAKTGEYINA